MSDNRKKENAVVISQEMLADGIFSMWLRTEASQTAVPGQFISMYTNDGTKLLPRPISICEIDKAGGALRVVYRVTGENTGTKQFSECKPGDTIPVIGPLGNGFPLDKAEGKKAFLMGGGIGVPPILELSKQLKNCEKQIVMGYRDANTFLKEQFEENGAVYVSTEDDDYYYFVKAIPKKMVASSDKEIIQFSGFSSLEKFKERRKKKETPVSRQQIVDELEIMDDDFLK